KRLRAPRDHRVLTQRSIASDCGPRRPPRPRATVVMAIRRGPPGQALADEPAVNNALLRTCKERLSGCTCKERLYLRRPQDEPSGRTHKGPLSLRPPGSTVPASDRRIDPFSSYLPKTPRQTTISPRQGCRAHCQSGPDIKQSCLLAIVPHRAPKC